MKKIFLMRVLLTLETSFILIGSIVTLTHIKREKQIIKKIILLM